jgi:hypothetical protein
MKLRRKLVILTMAGGLLLAAEAPALAGWTISFSSLQRSANDVSICAGKGRAGGTVILSSSTRAQAPAFPGLGIGSTLTFTESLYATPALAAGGPPVVNVVITETVTGPKDASDYWPLTGTGTASLPSSHVAGSVLYAARFVGFGVDKTPVLLTVNDPKYACKKVKGGKHEKEKNDKEKNDKEKDGEGKDD